MTLDELAQLAQDDQDRAYIAEQAAELERAEAMQNEADKYWQLAQQMGVTLVQQAVEAAQANKSREISQGQVGWLSEKKIDVPLEQRFSPNGKTFLFGRVTEASKRTRVNEQVFPEPVMVGIEEAIVRHIGSKIDAPDRRARDLRPLEPSATREHTSFNPYKDDNLSINNDDGIRALILEDGSNRDEPVYYLASVCTHDEQQQLIYGL